MHGFSSAGAEHLALSNGASGYLASSVEAYEKVLATRSLYHVSEQDAPMFDDTEVRLYRLRRTMPDARPAGAAQSGVFDRFAALEIVVRHPDFQKAFASDTAMSVNHWICAEEPFWLVQIGRPAVVMGSLGLIDRVYFAVHQGTGELFKYSSNEAFIASLYNPDQLKDCL